MANTFVVSRNHLILGLCLPLAVVLGFLLAEPLDKGSVVVIGAVMGVLCVPLLMRWHHWLLVVGWNAAITPQFLPGRPALWMVLAFLSLFFSILGRTVNQEKKLLHVPALTRPLFCLLAVVFGTAMLTGGVGLKAIGSQNFGGKGYVIILSAIVGYFALSCQVIPRERRWWYVGAFFLSGLTAGVSNLVFAAGPQFYILYQLFPSDLAEGQVWAAAGFQTELVRLNGLVWTSQAVYGFLLARYGIPGVFTLTRPWRLVLLVGSVFISLYGGFRVGLILFGLVFMVLFCLEGLWKTRTLWAVLALAGVVSLATAAFVDRLPWSVQRALSFLPINVDPVIEQSAQRSTEWRLEIWRSVWPEVPRYLLKGKGYALNRQELILLQDASLRGYATTSDVALFAGDYHNGPLSLIIPFGLWGVVAFGWFLAAAARMLYNNYRYGDPELRRINAYLLAFFIARVIFFFGIFGSFFGELFYFTGLAGLSVALNRGEARPRTDLKSVRGGENACC